MGVLGIIWATGIVGKLGGSEPRKKRWEIWGNSWEIWGIVGKLG